jgi:hypothetical protein
MMRPPGSVLPEGGAESRAVGLGWATVSQMEVSPRQEILSIATRAGGARRR